MIKYDEKKIKILSQKIKKGNHGKPILCDASAFCIPLFRFHQCATNYVVYNSIWVHVNDVGDFGNVNIETI